MFTSIVLWIQAHELADLTSSGKGESLGVESDDDDDGGLLCRKDSLTHILATHASVSPYTLFVFLKDVSCICMRAFPSLSLSMLRVCALVQIWNKQLTTTLSNTKKLLCNMGNFAKI